LKDDTTQKVIVRELLIRDIPPNYKIEADQTEYKNITAIGVEHSGGCFVGAPLLAGNFEKSYFLRQF